MNKKNYNAKRVIFIYFCWRNLFMILIADGGSTKCTWAECSVDGEIVKIHQTVGFNPKYTNDKSLLTELHKSSLETIKAKVTEIQFYGAGCSSKKRNE